MKKSAGYDSENGSILFSEGKNDDSQSGFKFLIEFGKAFVLLEIVFALAFLVLFSDLS